MLLFLLCLRVFAEERSHGAVTDGFKKWAEDPASQHEDTVKASGASPDGMQWAQSLLKGHSVQWEKEQRAESLMDHVLNSAAKKMIAGAGEDLAEMAAELTPKCRSEMIGVFETFLTLEAFIDPDAKYYNLIHATQTGDAQVGQMQQCLEFDGGEYCWALKPFTMMAQKVAPIPLANGTYGVMNPYGIQGCCVPTPCAYDPRDAPARLLLCNPDIWILLTAVEIAEKENVIPEKYKPYLGLINQEEQFKTNMTICGTSKQPRDFGTYLMWSIIAFLGFMVILASMGQYFHDVYVAPKLKTGDGKFSKKDVETSLKLIVENIPPSLKAFSWQRNWKTLMERKDRPTNFLDGIRAMSYMWVVMGHSYSNANNLGTWYANLNHVHEKVLHKLWAVTFVTDAPFSVDTFFWLGGFLFAYLSIRKFDKMSLTKFASFTPFIYIIRWLRLTPVVMFGLCMAWKVLPQLLGDETPVAIAEILDFELHTCKEYWYLYMGYILTLKAEWLEPPKFAIMCMGHLWYLSTEFQMVWFTPIIFFGYLSNRFLGMFLAFVGVIVGLCSAAQVSADNYHGQSEMTVYYLRALPRCGAYFIGFLLGLVCYTLEKHFKSKNWGRPRISVMLSSALQAVAGAMMLFWLQYPHTDGGFDTYGVQHNWNAWQRHQWTIWARPGWAFSLSVLCISLLYGPQKGIIAGILNWSFWGPMAKLSFAGYVLHFPLFYLRILYTPIPEHYTPDQRLHLWLGHTCISTFAAFCTWFLVEAPFATLAKLLVQEIQKWLGGGKKKGRGDGKIAIKAHRALPDPEKTAMWGGYATNDNLTTNQSSRPRQKTNEGVPEPELGTGTSNALRERQKTNEGIPEPIR